MLQAISTYLFRAPLGVHLLDEITRAGFTLVEIDCARAQFDYRDASLVRELAEWFADSRVQLHAMHAPLYGGVDGPSPHNVVSLALLDRQRRQDSMDEIKRVIEISERLPFRFLIAHLGVEDEEFDLRKFDAALTSLEHLRVFSRQCGVEILLENTLNELASPSRLMEFFQHTHLHKLQVCFDVAHAHLDGGVEPALKLLKGRIGSVHLHDTSGGKDDHLMPGQGVIEWDKIMPLLRRQIPGATLVIEARSTDPPAIALEKAATAARHLDEIAVEAAS